MKDIELVNLEEYVDYVVKVVRRDDRILYGTIKNRPYDEYRPFLFDLGNGGISYHKCGRTIEKAICGYDIIWIKKTAKEPENE